MVATDEPAANTLGRFGAALASTLIIIGGKGTWAIPLILCAWGLRFVLHRGAERAVSRMVFAVIAIAMASVYAATLLPSAMWVQSFGMGGLFGDTVVGALMNIIPGGSAIGLKLISLASGAAMVALMLFVTGFNFPEIRTGFRFLITSLIYSYSILLGAADKGAQGTTRAAAAIHARRKRNAAEAARPDETLRAPADWREDRPQSTIRRAEPAVEATPPAQSAFGRPSTLRADARYAEPLAEAPQYAPPREKLGLLARALVHPRRSFPPSPLPSSVANPPCNARVAPPR